MSGLYSRNKGKRNEYLLRDLLRSQGWVADRVPSSGAAQGFKGDIRASKGDCEVLLELKARANSFSKLYKMAETGGLGAYAHNQGCVILEPTLDRVLESPLAFYPPREFGEHAVKGVETAMKLKKLLGESQILVVRDDRKPMIFIRYVG